MARLCLRVGSILTADMADHTVTAQVAASEDIIADLAIALAAPDQMPASAGRRRVAQAISLMHDRHREPITLASLARELGCSCRSFAKQAMRRPRTFWPGSGWTRRGSGCCRAGTVSPPRWTAASAIWAGLPLPIAAALAKDRRRPCPQGRERRNGEVSFGMAARQNGGSILGCADGLAIRNAKNWRETGRNHAHGNCVLRRQFRWLRPLQGQSLNHTALTPGAALTGQRTELARRFLIHCDLKVEPPMKPHPSASDGGKIFFSLYPDKARLAPHCTSGTGRLALRATETAGGAQGRRRTGNIVPHQRSRRFEFSVQVTNRGFRIATPRQASVRGSSSGAGIGERPRRTRRHACCSATSLLRAQTAAPAPNLRCGCIRPALAQARRSVAMDKQHGLGHGLYRPA